MQFTVDLYVPGPGEPTAEELKQQLIKKNPKYFPEIPLNQRVYIRDDEEIKGFLNDLYVQGYRGFVVNISYVEVVPTRPGAGNITGILCVCSSIILVLIGFNKRKKELLA